MSKDRLVNICVVIVLVVVVLLCIYGWHIGIFRDLNTLRAYVDKAGMFGPAIFILVQLLQIVIPFIPGGVAASAGVVIFGPLQGFCLNYLGNALGSMMSFGLARHYGHDFVHDKVNPAIWQKYFRWLDNKKIFLRLFAIMILLPFAPDDALCMLAGISGISWLQFLFCILIFKIPTLLVYSFAVIGADTFIL